MIKRSDLLTGNGQPVTVHVHVSPGYLDGGWNR
jgi:hypothetical protein